MNLLLSDPAFLSVAGAESGGGGDVDPYFSNVSLLLHGDGANGSSSIIDSSNSGLTFVNTGPVTVSTSEVKYGTGSLYFANNQHTLVSPASSAFAFGTGDFTIEWWQRVVSPAWRYDFGLFFSIGNYGTSPHISFALGSTLIGVVNQAASGFSRSTARGTDGVFHHVALVRSSGVTRFFYDGALIGVTDLTTGNFGNSILYLNRVSLYSDSGVNNGLHVDDLRITKGVARSSFTPPTAPFPDA